MYYMQSQRFQVERTLKMLTLLGSQGEAVYDRFLKLLEITGHTPVADELRKSHQFTHFGNIYA